MKVLIPMAGLGSRFSKIGIKDPKPLIEVQGKTLIEHSVKSFDVDAEFIFITRRFDDPAQNLRLSEMLKTLRPASTEICIDHVTNGASQTCLAARHLIDDDDQLVIYNCDQLITWNATEFVDFCANNTCDGAIVLYNSTDPKNSFAEITDGLISRVAEKKAISQNALIGFHYWRRGRDFVRSATELVEAFHSLGQPECYVSETYNSLIDEGMMILPYFVSNNTYIPLGTPEDVARYQGKMKEFYGDKPKTIFCDIDGTLLKHAHKISDVLVDGNAVLLEGVRQKIDQWDSQGHRIILVTARKESTRAVTEAQLSSLGIAYDQLIMGITSGARILINDKLSMNDADRAVAVNVETDAGFVTISWEDHGL